MDKTFDIGNYNDTVDKILFWKFSFVKYNNKVINCYNIPFFPFVKDNYMIENPAACIKLGDNKRSILGSPAYQGYFIAILMIK